MLGRVSSPRREDKASPRRGLKFRRLTDARKGIEADRQHKTAICNQCAEWKNHSAFFLQWRNMGKEQDRKAIVAQINAAAALYKQHLVGRRYMYVFDNRCVEVLFKKKNFRHLTGVDSNFSAEQFFDLAARGQLRAEQVIFPKHSYDLCEKKSRFICDIATLARSESFMLEQIDTSTATFAIGTTDLNFSLCMNKWGNDECYSVDSLRVDDCFSKSKNVFAITHIFSRLNDEKKYTEAHYCEQKESPLPTFVKEALSPELISKMENENQTIN